MTAEDAMLDAMRAWKDFHNREAKRLSERLRPAIPRNVSPLRYIGGYDHEPWSKPDPVGLVHEMKRIINSEGFAGDATHGWDAALRNADPRFLWEALILDANADYASLWSHRERAIVAGAIAETYARFAAEDVAAS